MIFSAGQNDLDKGNEAFVYFHNKSIGYPIYKYTKDEALIKIAGSQKSVSSFLDGLGFTVSQIQSSGFLSGNKVKNAMENLAIQSGGRLPNRNSFFSALSGEAQNFTFLEAAPSVISGTASEIIKGTQAVGDSVLTTLKSLNVLFPIVFVAGVLYIVFEKTKKLAK